MAPNLPLKGATLGMKNSTPSTVLYVMPSNLANTPGHNGCNMSAVIASTLAVSTGVHCMAVTSRVLRESTSSLIGQVYIWGTLSTFVNALNNIFVTIAGWPLERGQLGAGTVEVQSWNTSGLMQILYNERVSNICISR